MDIFDFYFLKNFAIIFGMQKENALTAGDGCAKFISRQVARGRYFFCDLNPPQNADFKIVCAGCEECAPNYDLKRDSFLYYGLEWVYSGEFLLENERGSFVLQSGSAFAYSPKSKFRLRARGAAKPVKYFADFVGKFAPKILKESSISLQKPTEPSNAEWIYKTFESLLDCAYLSRRCAAKTGANLAQNIMFLMGEGIGAGASAGGAAKQSFDRCARFVNENYASIKSVAEISSACALNESYMSRLFKKFAGRTPSEFLLNLKMDFAAELLIRQNAGVKEAACAVAFDDPYHFSRAFKRRHGQSPKIFADRLRRAGGF